MLYLLITLAALCAGPALAGLARRLRTTTIALDAFVLVVLGGLVVLHILPHALHDAGLWALLVAAITFFLVGKAESGLHDHAHGEGGRIGARLMLGLTMLGLFVHQIVDGVAVSAADDPLATTNPEHRELWALAVILHSLPKSIALWWIVAPLFGLRAAIGTVALSVVGTLVGYFLGSELLAFASPFSIAIFEAVLCGALAHVVMHADLPAAPAGIEPRAVRLASLVGLVLGVGVIALVEGGHSHSHEHADGGDFLHVFFELAATSAPALVLAYLGIGLLAAFVPKGIPLLGRGGPSWLAALRGIAVGLPLPVCSCGVVPMYRDLVQRGARTPAAIAFLVATPELEIAALLLTWQMLGPSFAIARIAAAVGLALIAAVVTSRVAKPVEPLPFAGLEEDRPIGGLFPKLRAGMRNGFGESVDETAPWILVGLGLAALLTPLLDPGALRALPSLAAVPLAALIGMPVYVCASGSTPLAAVLVAHGLSPGAAIAFLLTGPATNVTTFGVLARLHGGATARTFAVTMFGGATAAGLAVDAILSGSFAAPAAGHVHHALSTLELLAVGVLGLVILASILRQGVRRFLGQLFDTPTLAELTAPHDDHAGKPNCCSQPSPPASGHAHDHAHAHGHAHRH
jgi:uncharacterized membrane protein YraQ (UPF0718 family)